MTLLTAGEAVLIAMTTVGLPVTWLSTTVARVSVLVLALAAAFLCLPIPVRLFALPAHLPKIANLTTDATLIVAHQAR